MENKEKLIQEFLEKLNEIGELAHSEQSHSNLDINDEESLEQFVEDFETELEKH